MSVTAFTRTGERGPIVKKWMIALLTASLAAFLLSIPIHILREQYDYQAQLEQKALVMEQVSSIRDDFQAQLDTSLFYADFFEMIVRQDPFIAESELREYARFIVDRNELIDNVSVARDGVIHFVYPLQGNEAVIGLDLTSDDNLNHAIQATPDGRSGVTQGPLESVQGGLKLLTHKPIYIDAVSAEEQWGYSSVTIDFEEMVSASVHAHQNDLYDYAIRISSGSQSPYIWGSAGIFEEESVSQSIELFDSHWTVGAVPLGGWGVHDERLNQEMLVFYLLITIIFIMVYYFTLQYLTKREMSRKDALTGLLNKHTFESTVRRLIRYSTQKNGLLLIDFNDFKTINDKHGHLIGDKVLSECAARMKEIVKYSDKVGRIGGDEFMILVKDIGNEENLSKVAERIVSQIEKPIDMDQVSITPSVSVGFVLTSPSHAFENIYDIVDKRMYKHKEASKDALLIKAD